MNWRSLLLTVLCLTAVLALSIGCTPQGDIAYPGSEAGNGEEAGEEETQDAVAPVDGENNGDEPGQEDQQTPGTGEQATQPSTVRIVLYFTDEAAIKDDIPGETGYLKAVTRDCPYTQGVLRLALQELIRGPLPGEGDLGHVLPASTGINSLKIENRIAMIDFSGEVVTAPDALGGSFGGGLFMQSIVFTATQFPTVDRVLVTVEGEPWSDGHYIWEEPIGREDIGF